MLKDELQALQMAYNSLEMKFGKTQEENRELVTFTYVFFSWTKIYWTFFKNLEKGANVLRISNVNEIILKH